MSRQLHISYQEAIWCWIVSLGVSLADYAESCERATKGNKITAIGLRLRHQLRRWRRPDAARHSRNLSERGNHRLRIYLPVSYFDGQVSPFSLFVFSIGNRWLRRRCHGQTTRAGFASVLASSLFSPTPAQTPFRSHLPPSTRHDSAQLRARISDVARSERSYLKMVEMRPTQ